ncbi:hypothetical protein Lal_00000685 [Lupinus albus]|nr:hypothetical protein Lal_00000685 [Lupinus albus]
MTDASPARQLSGEELVSGLLRLLDVDDLGGDRFLGRRKPGGVGRVFGGQVIGQALAAAERTVPEDRPVHSLHAYFLRGGNEDYEIDFRVERDLDGGSFSNRRIVASQLGKPILTMLASFHRREPGARHASPMPAVPAPEDLANERELRRRHLDKLPKSQQEFVLRQRPIDLRPHGRSAGRSEDSPRGAGLRQRHDAAGHLHASPRSALGQRQRDERQPRSRHLVPRRFPRRRMAALCLRQPVGGPCARVQPGQHLHARRPAGRQPAATTVRRAWLTRRFPVPAWRDETASSDHRRAGIRAAARCRAHRHGAGTGAIGLSRRRGDTESPGAGADRWPRAAALRTAHHQLSHGADRSGGTGPARRCGNGTGPLCARRSGRDDRRGRPGSRARHRTHAGRRADRRGVHRSCAPHRRKSTGASGPSPDVLADTARWKDDRTVAERPHDHGRRASPGNRPAACRCRLAGRERSGRARPPTFVERDQRTRASGAALRDRLGPARPQGPLHRGRSRPQRKLSGLRRARACGSGCQGGLDHQRSAGKRRCQPAGRSPSDGGDDQRQHRDPGPGERHFRALRPPSAGQRSRPSRRGRAYRAGSRQAGQFGQFRCAASAFPADGRAVRARGGRPALCHCPFHHGRRGQRSGLAGWKGRMESIGPAPSRCRRISRQQRRLLQAGRAHLSRRAEVQQQRPLARRANARNFIKRAGRDRAAALFAVRADGEAVNLVAQALQVEQHRRIDRQHLLPPVREMEHFPPFAAVMRPLGDGDQRHVVDAEFLQRLAHRAHLALAAVDQHEIGPDAAFAIRVFLLRAGEPAAEHLAHHREIVVGLRRLDIPFAVLAVEEPVRPRHDHRPQRVRALDMAVVVDLDALRRFGQFQKLGHLAVDLRLGAGFGQTPLQRFHRVAAGLLHQPPPVAPLRHRNLDLAAGRLLQGLRQQIGFRQRPVDQDQARRRHFLVELGKEAGEHLGFLQPFGMAGKERAMAPVLPAPDEEGLDADMPALRRHGEDIGIAHAFGVDRLAALDERGRAQAVAQHRRAFEIERFRSLRHLPFDLALHGGRLPPQEIARLAHQIGIVVLADPADAGRRTAPDLVKQARPVAPCHEAIVARAQQKQLLQRVDRGVDRSGTGEGAIVVPLRLARAAMLHDARKRMVGAQQDERKRFIVAQQHVVRRAEALDELRFQQQRLGFGIGRDDGHRPAPGPCLHRARPARIVHAIDAGLGGQRAHHLADGGTEPRAMVVQISAVPRFGEMPAAARGGQNGHMHPHRLTASAWASLFARGTLWARRAGLFPTSLRHTQPSEKASESADGERRTPRNARHGGGTAAERDVPRAPRKRSRDPGPHRRQDAQEPHPRAGGRRSARGTDAL